MRLAANVVIVSLLGIPSAHGQDAPRPKPGAHVVRLNGHAFTLPDGFAIEVAAPSALVPRPITADFDEAGYLYVSDSSGTNDKVQDQLAKKPHRVLRLKDSKGDGRFDQSTIFADKLMFPEGTMWLDGSLYVSAPPSIWKLTDADGDGVAETRSEWFQGKTLTGCANDLHGPYLGPDGWVYWCKGAFAKQTYDLPGRGAWSTRAAHIFRSRPDGSGLEPVMTGGMDNPVHVVALPNGERFFTTTFFQHPAFGRRDGLVHAIYGGVYGKVHDVLDDHPWTGPNVMPVLTHMGPAAPCGLVRYESAAFGPEYRDNLFACQFNLHKVSRHVLTPEGSSYASRDEDFLVSDNIDFHPTHVLEDADGSLLVIDTGGWYKLCCPSSQLHKPEILGAIYRIRRSGAPKVDDPRGLKLNWQNLSAGELAGLLDDARPAVRRRAMQTLAKKGAEAVDVLAKKLTAKDASADVRRNCVWILARVEQSQSRAAVRQALADADESVRQAALNVVSLHRDADAGPQLRQLLETGAPLNRRLAAEALGRIGDPRAVPMLLKAAQRPADRFLEHAITFALISMAAPAETERGLTSPNPNVQRAAFVALDQMSAGHLPAGTVVKHLDTRDATLKETLLWIAGRHPQWGPAMADFLREQLANPAAPDEVRRLLARFAASPAIQKLVVETLSREETPQTTKKLLLNAMADSRLKEAPEPWVETLVALLNSKDADVVQEAVRTVRQVTVPKPKAGKLSPALVRLAEGDAPDALRMAALAAVPGGPPALSPALFAFVRGHLGKDRPVTERALAVDILARAKLTADQLVALTESLNAVGPLEVDRLLESFTQSTSEPVGLALVGALRKSSLLGSLRVDSIKTRLAKFPPAVRSAAEELYVKIDADLAGQAQRLDGLLKSQPPGDVNRGHAVFFSAKAACISCHALAYQGGRVGPDLTRIGAIRSERDLLESIVFPSASIVRSYEPVLIETKAGKSHNGLIKSETPEEIELVIGAEQTVRIPRGEIEEIQPSKVSVMPAGMEKVLTPQELADLVAFLKSRK
ncbi:MAG: PVC-type heme-binding CxxCH protein [Gemmataceae bacterium]